MANLLEELLQPISEASFCGEDGSYEPEFEAAKAEAEKITENDFRVMAEASQKFLTKKSKDMRVLGYFIVGTGLSGSLTNFGLAIQAYCKLVTGHWEDIHPKRPAARSNALKMLNQERTLNLLGSANGGGDYEILKAAHEELVNLQSFCEGKFPEGAPSFGGFVKLVKEHAEKNKPREEAPDAPVESASSTQPQAQSAPSAIGSMDDAFMAIQKAGYYILEQDRANPLAYRLNRILKWSGIQANLPNDGGRTMFPAPYPHVLEGLKEMMATQRWADLTGIAEETFSSDSGVLWLDLQRYLCTALQAQGGGFAACSKAIRIELAMLVQRAPDLQNLTFEDGTPFADAMTKEWIQNEVSTSLGGGGGPSMAPIKKKGDVGEEQKQAEILLGEGKLDQALHTLRTGLVNDSSEKNNFDRKLIMAELCYKGNKPNIAKALLEDILGAMDRYDLVKWDPDLCVSVYHLAQKVYLGLFEIAEDFARPALREKALAMHSQISKLNPVLAISADFK